MNTINASSDRLSARLWFALLGAPAAWGVQLTAGWLVTDFGCRSHGAISKLSPDTLRLIDGAISIVTLAVALAAVAVGVRAWRRSHDTHLSSLHGAERPDFIAAVALFVAAAFTLGIIWSSLGSLLLDGCEAMR